MTLFENMSVLLIDDEADYLNTLVKRMSKRKINVSAANSGKEAIGFLKDTQVDCVVLDVKMPDMDGVQVLREIKMLYPLIEVIMLTGHADMDVAMEIMELGAFDYLMKPVDFNELLYKLHDAYEKKTLDDEKRNQDSDVV